MNVPLPLDLTVRVGCSLAYEVTGAASVLLNVQPHAARNCAIIFEALSLGDNLSSHEFVDHHGNRFLRIKLAPGTNCIRHDAILSVSSEPGQRRPSRLPAAFP